MQKTNMKSKNLFILLPLLTLLSACGTLTGIPAHGGGKRFAVEQELVAASARAAVKNMDLKALQGRKVALFVSVMGDQGSGSMSGGRYSIDALIRGEYANNPASQSDYTYPNYQTTATTESDGLTGTTRSLSTLNAPSLVRNKTRGSGSSRNIGLNTGGMGEYRNETLTTNPRDAAFLDNLIQTVFFLRGIDIVDPAYADTEMFVTVDVFGTIRSRTELHAYNAETLKAQTKLEYFAVDRQSRRTVIPPKTAAFETAYRENYAFWAGPYKVQKTVKAADGLMVDFSDITPYGTAADTAGTPAPAAARQPENSRQPESTGAADGGAERPVRNEILRKRQPEK